MITIAVPPTNASPTLRFRSPWRTSWPSPPAPTTAAITTMPSAIMIVWLTPSMIEGFARGSCTFMRRCREVVPNESATSIAPDGTPRIPRLVRRTAGGSAKITVEINAVVSPMLKKSTSRIR